MSLLLVLLRHLSYASLGRSPFTARRKGCLAYTAFVMAHFGGFSAGKFAAPAQSLEYPHLHDFDRVDFRRDKDVYWRAPWFWPGDINNVPLLSQYAVGGVLPGDLPLAGGYSRLASPLRRPDECSNNPKRGAAERGSKSLCEAMLSTDVP